MIQIKNLNINCLLRYYLISGKHFFDISKLEIKIEINGTMIKKPDRLYLAKGITVAEINKK